MAGFVKTKSTVDGGSTLKQSEQAITIPTGGTANRTSAPVAGEFRFNTDLSKMEFYDGAAFKTIPFQGTSAITQDSFTGDGSTVAFTMSTSVTGNQEQRVVVAVGNEKLFALLAIPDNLVTFAANWSNCVLVISPVADVEELTGSSEVNATVPVVAGNVNVVAVPETVFVIVPLALILIVSTPPLIAENSFVS